MNAQAWMGLLDAAGHRVGMALLGALWQSSLLFAAVGLLAFALRNRPARVRHALWVGAVLLAPLLPLLASLGSDAHAPQVAVPLLPPYAQPPVVPAHALPAPAPDVPAPLPAVVRTHAGPGGACPLPSLWAVAFLGYGAGLTGILLWMLAGRIQLAAWLRSAVPETDTRVTDAFRRARERLRLTNDVAVLTCARVTAPVTFGIFRPVILLPANLSEQLSDDDLRAVALHEVTHVRRRDPALLQWMVLARTALFFHPLAWVACREASVLAEQACDEEVVRAQGEPVPYARLLTRFAEQARPRPSCAGTGMGIALGRSAFLRRVAAVLSTSTDRARRLSRAELAGTALAAAAALAVALALPLAARAQAPVASPSSRTAGAAEAETASLICKGIVQDEKGRPVPGARVWCERSRPQRPVSVEAEARSVADGRFTLPAIPAKIDGRGGRTLFVDHPDYGLAWKLLSPDDPDDEFTFVLTTPAAMGGAVLGGEGRSVSGAEVTAQAWHKRYGWAELPLRDARAVKSDEKGRFRIERLPQEARVSFIVRHPRYATWRSESDPSKGLPAGDMDVSILLIPGGAVAGRLVMDGKPFRKGGIAVLVFGRRTGDFALTDPEGAFRVACLPPGAYNMYVASETLSPDVTYLPRTGIAVQADATATADIEVTKGVLLKGRVRDEKTGVGVANEHLWIPAKEHIVASAVAVTDAEGRFAVRLTPGTFEIVANGWQDGRAKVVREEVTVVAGVPPAEVVINLPVRPTLSVRLVDREGRPVKGIVYIGGKPTMASADGVFRIAEPWGGAQRTFGYAMDETKTLGRGIWLVDAERKEPLTLVLTPTMRIVGRIVGEKGEAVPDAAITLHVGPFKEGTFTELQAAPWRISRQADGLFTIEPVPEGLPLYLYANTPTQHGGKNLPGVEPGNVLDVGNLAVRSTTKGITNQPPEEWKSEISGRVVDETGKPVAGVSVRADPPSKRVEAVSDGKGRFRLTGLPANAKLDVWTSDRRYGHQGFAGIATGREDVELRIVPPAYELYGKPAPEIVAVGWINTNPLALAQLRGKVVLLHLGVMIGSYADYADQALRAAELYSARGLVVIGVHVDLNDPGGRKTTREEIERRLAKNKITFPFAIDRPAGDLNRENRLRVGATCVTYGIRALPTFILIDKAGVVRGSGSGANLADLEPKIRQLLAE